MLTQKHSATPTEVLGGLNLTTPGYDPPLLLFREEYATALAKANVLEETSGVVVTGYSGIGT